MRRVWHKIKDLFEQVMYRDQFLRSQDEVKFLKDELKKEVTYRIKLELEADDKLKEHNELQQVLDECNIHAETLKEHLKQKEMEVERLKETIKAKEDEYNNLVFPKTPLKGIEEKLKFIDNLTIDTLIEFLQLDSYELVKNIGKVVNDSNAANTISYRDGALTRNEALIKRLKDLRKPDIFFDKITGEQRTVSSEMKQKKKSL